MRENTEGEYTTVGGVMFEGTEREIVIQESVFTRHGTDRVLKFAFELARAPRASTSRSRPRATASRSACRGGTRRAADVGAAYPDVTVTSSTSTSSVRASCCSRIASIVVVATNLFGDILSDLGPACTGTIGLAPSANLNPERKFSVAVRAGARLGARHRRPEHRQSRRDDLVGRDDARLPRPRARGPAHAAHDAIVAAIEAVYQPKARARAISAARPRRPKSAAGDRRAVGGGRM